jgi:hypothetical protein
MIFGTNPVFWASLASDESSQLVSITLPKDSIDGIRQELRDAGISESVVFPDLDGLGRELKQQWETEG